MYYTEKLTALEESIKLGFTYHATDGLSKEECAVLSQQYIGELTEETKKLLQGPPHPVQGLSNREALGTWRIGPAGGDHPRSLTAQRGPRKRVSVQICRAPFLCQSALLAGMAGRSSSLSSTGGTYLERASS